MRASDERAGGIKPLKNNAMLNEKIENSVRVDAEANLQYIRRMIDETRRSVSRNAGEPFLIMGYATVAVALAVWYALCTTADPRWNFLWLLLMAAGAVTVWRARRKEASVRTYLDRVIGSVWWILSLSLLPACLAVHFQPLLPILYVVTLLMGCGEAITGLIIRQRCLTVAGLIGALILAPAMLLVGTWSLLLFAATFAVMMIIPGHVLQYQERNSHA